jgi:hypothetical protein
MANERNRMNDLENPGGPARERDMDTNEESVRGGTGEEVRSIADEEDEEFEETEDQEDEEDEGSI